MLPKSVDSMDMLNSSRSLQNPVYGGNGKQQPLYDEIGAPMPSKAKSPPPYAGRSPYSDPVVRQVRMYVFSP